VEYGNDAIGNILSVMTRISRGMRIISITTPSSTAMWLLWQIGGIRHFTSTCGGVFIHRSGAALPRLMLYVVSLMNDKIIGINVGVPFVTPTYAITVGLKDIGWDEE
jgi:hypothetical protein